jgi:hypothetical protein
MLKLAVRLFLQKPHTALCKPTKPYEQERPDTLQRIKCGGLRFVRPSVKNKRYSTSARVLLHRMFVADEVTSYLHFSQTSYHWHNPSGRTMALGLTQPLTEMTKVKESPNRPGMAQRVPGGLGSQIFMTFGT